MQLPPSADLLIPVGVGVLVAVVAVVALVIGLRRRADDASVPTHDDWTGEHVGDVVAPPMRTVADAVAARQGNTGPFVVVSPGQGADEQDVADSGADAPVRERKPVKGLALPLSVCGSEVSTSGLGVGRPRHTVHTGARATSSAPAADAAPTAVSDARPTAADGATPAPATVLTAEARHCRSADDGEGPTYPSDPLFGAGWSDEGDGAWFGPSARPQAHQGGPSAPGAADRRPGGSSDELPEQRSDTGVDHRPDAAPAASSPPDEPAGPGRPEDRPGNPLTDPALSAPAPEPAHPLAARPAVPPPSAGGMGQERSRDHRPAAGGPESTPVAARPVDDRPVTESAGLTPAADPIVDGSPVAGGVGSAPAGLSADGHPVAGAESGPANSDSSTAGHPAADGTEPGRAAGSSQSVAAAVAQVLAARAAAKAPDGDRRGDARDRLLAVLLDDPMRAVGATVDLQECQERLDRLTASLKDEHGRLGDVLGRLACSGLRPDQLARLSGLSDIEVAELLRRRPGA